MGLTLFHRIFSMLVLNMGIFYKILSVPQNIVMDMNNVMYLICPRHKFLNPQAHFCSKTSEFN